VLTTGGNLPDISKAVELLDAVPPVAGRPGRPRHRFAVLLADKGYDSRAFRDACRRRRTEPIIPRRGTTGLKDLGKLRYVVEQPFGLLHQFRRLAVRWERRLDIHDGFVSLACALISLRTLINWTARRDPVRTLLTAASRV
jgi:transposase